MSVALAALASLLCAAGLVDLLESRPAGPSARWGRLARALRGLGVRLGAPAPAADLHRRLDAAGSSLTPRDATAIKAGGAAAALAASAPVAAASPGRASVLLALGAAAGGFVALDLHLRRRATARAGRMELELADVLDLLRVAVEAGLPPMRALGEVGSRHGGLLAAELRTAAERAELGVPRDDALHALRARAPLPGVAALVAVIERAERHGAPPSPALAALAADARARRGQRLRDDAARAAPKIQLVVALLLVPAVMALVAASLTRALL